MLSGGEERKHTVTPILKKKLYIYKLLNVPNKWHADSHTRLSNREWLNLKHRPFNHVIYRAMLAAAQHGWSTVYVL